jgi:hypothetical protein
MIASYAISYSPKIWAMFCIISCGAPSAMSPKVVKMIGLFSLGILWSYCR